jgi:hypothetical protein
MALVIEMDTLGPDVVRVEKIVDTAIGMTPDVMIGRMMADMGISM